MSAGSDFDCTADELLGSYALASQLASGHLTTLHRGHAAGISERPELNRADATLVIKRLHYSHVHEHADRELLLAAGRAGMRVRSPHVVRVLAVHEDPEPFLVLEHIDGVLLSTLLADTLPQEVLRYVFPILVDVLEGLEVLHGLRDATGTAASLVHGAPSARHVLIGDDGVARLIDLTHATGPGFSVAARRSLRLRPAEMAPEQVLAPMHVDARCDLFIVGTVLWRALTGQPLFEHAQREEALQQLLRKPILAPSEAGSPLGKRFDRVCMRALARPRAERYLSAAEMARELKAEAERASLYASREEIASLVRTLALANQDAEETSEIVLTATEVDTESRAAASMQVDAPASEPEALDILTSHHQGSSRFGFARSPLSSIAGPRPDVLLGAAQAAHAEAIPSVSESSDEAHPAEDGRESGTWYEGLPSIFPSREAPRHTTSVWLWGVAAAAALLGGVLIDSLPWQVAGERVREQPLGESQGLVRSDMAAAPAGALGYAAYFDSQRSMKSSALPPRIDGEPRARDEAAQPKEPSALTCPPAERPMAQALAPAQAAPEAPATTALEQDAVHNVSTLAPAAGVKPATRFLSPLPPNPY